MAKEYINIHFGKVDLDVRAYLLTDFNPEVCQAFKNTLPNRSVMSHAVVAGEQMYWPYRLVVDRACCNTEDMAKQPPGRPGEHFREGPT